MLGPFGNEAHESIVYPTADAPCTDFSRRAIGIHGSIIGAT